MTQLLANGLTSASLYIIIGLGFGLIYFTTKHFHLAHAAVVTLGAYSGYLANGVISSSWALGALSATLIGGLAGLAMEKGVYRPFSDRSASSEIILIASLSLYILIANTVALLAGSETQLLRTGVAPTVSLGGAIVTVVQLLQIGVAVAVSAALAITLTRTTIGKSWRCVADSAELTALQGLNPGAIRLSVFGAGSALAGLGGYLVALDVGLQPHMGFQLGLAAIVSCIIGGSGRYLAPILGALVLGMTEAGVVGLISTRWKVAVTYLLLLLFLALRPQGLLGQRQRVEET